MTFNIQTSEHVLYRFLKACESRDAPDRFNVGRIFPTTTKKIVCRHTKAIPLLEAINEIFDMSVYVLENSQMIKTGYNICILTFGLGL